MAASFPASIKNFGPAKQDFTENILAAHVNDVQDEIVAIETNIGFNPHVGQDLVGTTTTYGSLKARIDAIISGVRTHTHAGADGVKLAQANTHQSPDTDAATTSLHHTLGSGANQAAAGNHGHTSGQVSGLDTHIASVSAHGVTGSVVGTTDTQSLTNKILTAIATGTTVVPVIARGASGQTANLQEWQNSAGTAVAHVSSNADLNTRTALAREIAGVGPTGMLGNTGLTVSSLFSNYTVLRARGIANQTGDLLRAERVGGTDNDAILQVMAAGSSVIRGYAGNTPLRVTGVDGLTPGLIQFHSQNSGTLCQFGDDTSNNKLRTWGQDGVSFIAIRASAFEVNSALATKDNIEDLDMGLDTVLQMHPVKYDSRTAAFRPDDPDVHDVGLVAEELNEIAPEFVAVNRETGRPEGIDYGRLTPVLIKAIQELSAKVEALEAQVV